jgi:hypothetical protein
VALRLWLPLPQPGAPGHSATSTTHAGEGPQGGTLTTSSVPTSGTSPGVLDADGDGFPADEDCDDADAQVHPGAEERVDGVDNDCDPTTCTSVGFASTPLQRALPEPYGGGEGWPPFYQLFESYPDCWRTHAPSYTTMDLTADGVLDLVVGYDCDDPDVGSEHYRVYPAGTQGFAEQATEWSLPEGYGTPESTPFYQFFESYPDCYGANAPSYTMMDLTADGVPDMVVGYACNDESVDDTHWRVYPGDCVE